MCVPFQGIQVVLGHNNHFLFRLKALNIIRPSITVTNPYPKTLVQTFTIQER